MTKTELEEWLQAYGSAWESRDPGEIELFVGTSSVEVQTARFTLR